MNKFLVYLSGPITGLHYKDGHDWREYATRCFPPHIQGVSPLRGHRVLENMGPIKRGVVDHPLITDRTINARNRFDTFRADVILVNLLGAERISIGTVMEIALAHDHNVPVICAIEPEHNLHDHPMVRDSISVRVSSLDEAIKAVISWVSPHESQIWTRIEQNHILREANMLDLNCERLKENFSGGMGSNH